MPQSYVPEDTTAVCTMMTNGSPQMIKLTNQRTVIFKGENKPLLNLQDNKLSGSFQCKSAAKFWGGLQALAIGVALGAAVVLTGGAALVVIAAACAVSVVAGVTALYKMAHDCDATLEIKWENEHSSVRINGKLAILNQSTLPCPKGPGKIDIIMDPAIAQEAAEYISNNNTKEVLAQMASQFAIGFISAASAGAGVAAGAARVTSVAVTAVVSGGMYPLGEWLTQEDNLGVVGGNSTTGVVGTLASSATTSNIVGNTPFIGNAMKAAAYAAEGFIIDNPIQRGILTYMSLQNLKQIKPKAFGLDKMSVGGLLASLTVGIVSDNYEGSLSEETKNKEDEYNNQDAQNGTSIIAQNI